MQLFKLPQQYPEPVHHRLADTITAPARANRIANATTTRPLLVSFMPSPARMYRTRPAPHGISERILDSHSGNHLDVK